MSFGSSKSSTDIKTEVVYMAPKEESSGEESPMSQWASLAAIQVIEKPNEKKVLYEMGLYAPGSGDVCNKYIEQSDSSIYRHVYYNYPAINDPGIMGALLKPRKPTIYADDGQELYLRLCSEMSLCPVRMFHRNLLSPEINLSYYGVDPRGVRAMAKALEYNKQVLLFNLTDNFLSDDSCFHLGEMLKTNVTLKTLILNGCRIGASGLLNLTQHTYMNRHLGSLNLARNNLGDSGGELFAKMLSQGLSVPNVNLSNNKLARETANAFTEYLEWKNPLAQLNLSWNSFGHVPSTTRMLNKMAESKVLQELNLSFTALEVGEPIANVLTIPTLKILDLSHNRLGSEAVTVIAGAMYKAKKLVTLNLSFNPMVPQDAYNTLEKMLRIGVKVQNLLMDGIDVHKSFLTLLNTVKSKKFRKNCVITYGNVLQNWTVEGPDPRNVIMNRALTLAKSGKTKVDVGVYFLTLRKEIDKPIETKTLLERMQADNVNVTESVVEQLTNIFPGPKSKKARTVNLELICDYIKQIWPDKKPPETPPPEHEPEPELLSPKCKDKKGKPKK